MKMIFIGGPLHLTSHNVNHGQVEALEPPSLDLKIADFDKPIPTVKYSRTVFRSAVMLTGGKGEDPLEVVFAELERARATLERVKGVLKDGWQEPYSEGLRARMFDAWSEIEKP
jgi:hypothetical protein